MNVDRFDLVAITGLLFLALAVWDWWQWTGIMALCGLILLVVALLASRRGN